MKGIEQDGVLLQAFMTGDEEAFSAIYRKYWFPMYQVVYRKTGNREVAEEVVQDIFTRIWKQRETLEISDLSRYLFSAVRYEVIDYYRTRVTYDDFDECLEDLESLAITTTEDTVYLNDLLDTIDRELEKLPEKSKEIFRLSRFHNWPVARIAQHLDLSEKAVEYHLSKVLKHLRIYLNNTLIFLMAIAEM
mgnify:CR=1 FL=1